MLHNGRMTKATTSKYMSSLNVRFPKKNEQPHIRAWLREVSVNDALPRGKAFDKYRYVNNGHESKSSSRADTASNG